MSEITDSSLATMDGNTSSSMDTSDCGEKKDTDQLGDMINSAAMSILDGEDFTVGPVQVK